MKKLILGIAIVSSVFASAQKKEKKDAKTLTAEIEAANKAAMDAYNANNYAVAAPKFMELYNLLKENGKEDMTFKYYAAINYASANNLDEAAKIYNELINQGFTGVQTSFTAKEKKSGKVQSFDKNTWELLKKSNSADYSDFKEEQTPNVEQNLYETLTTIYLNTKKNDEALALIEKGLAKFPDNAKLKEYQGTALYASGKTDQFMANLKEQLAKNPNDATNWYNLGVLQSKNTATVKEALASFSKAISLGGSDKKLLNNAYQNIVYATIGDDTHAVTEINGLRKTNPDKATELIEARKERFAQALPHAEKWYALDSNNLDVISILRDIYMVTKNQAKAAEMKAKEAAIQAQTK